MKPLKVLMLIVEGCLPPDSLEGIDEEALAVAPWKSEFDIHVTLEELGHKTRILPLSDDLNVLRQCLETFKPRIAFNLMEEFRGHALYDHNVVSYLELMGVKYTGCNPRGLMIARDKALSKKLLDYHRIPVPSFGVYRRGRRFRPPRRLQYPLFVKSVIEDASLGISQASLVYDDKSLRERVEFVHQHTGTDAIVEEYIDGRELYVGVLGNRRLEVLPVWEFVFEKRGQDKPLIASMQAKWSAKFQKRWGVNTYAAKDLDDGMRQLIEHRCRRIYRILGLSGFARIDFRLREDGTLFFLEANPNPNLAYGEDFAESAECKGISFEKLIQRILNLGLRWRPTMVS